MTVVFFVVSLNKMLNKRWFETPRCSCEVTLIMQMRMFMLIKCVNGTFVPTCIWKFTKAHLPFPLTHQVSIISIDQFPLEWRHNERDCVSNHRRHECLLNRLFRRRSKKTSKLRVTALCAGNSPVTGEFPTQRASNAENVSIWWRHHAAPYTGCQSHLQHGLCPAGSVAHSVYGIQVAERPEENVE